MCDFCGGFRGHKKIETTITSFVKYYLPRPCWKYKQYPSEVQQLIWDDFMTRYFSGTVAELQTAKPIFSSQCKVLFKQAFHRLIKDVAEEKGDDVQNWKMLQKKKVMASSIGRRTQRKIGC